MAEDSGMLSLSTGDANITIPVGRFRTPEEFNDWNCQHWLKQSRAMERRMADEDVLCVAIADLYSEAARQVPLCSQKSFENALETVAGSKARFQTTFSRKGGTASKPDALQKRILEIVRKRRGITESELLAKLEIERFGSPNIEVDRQLEAISFIQGQREKSAPISALKDRLSRAKKKIAKEEEKTESR